MPLKENKDKTPEQKQKETTWAAEQLGIELDPFDPLYDPAAQPAVTPPDRDQGAKKKPSKK